MLYDKVETRLKQLYNNPSRAEIIAISLSVALEQQLEEEEKLLKLAGLKYVPIGKGQYKLEKI